MFLYMCVHYLNTELYICVCVCVYNYLNTPTYIEDITRWQEDMNFMFEWQELYLTSEI